jgi:hypothetical protein
MASNPNGHGLRAKQTCSIHSGTEPNDSATKRRKTLACATTQTNPENGMLSERSHTQRPHIV